MPKSLYLYVDKNDYHYLMSFIKDNNGIFTANSEPYSALLQMDDVAKQTFFRIISASRVLQCDDMSKNADNRSFIACTNLRELNGTVQPMSLVLVNEADSEETCQQINSLFDEIKRYVKNRYRLSTNKTVYMGSFAFELWKRKEFRTTGLFLYKSERFTVDKNRFDEFSAWVNRSGYFLIDFTNYLTVKNRIINDSGNYLVTTKDANLFWYANRLNGKVYTEDSECIFLHREFSGKKRMQISIDERLCDGSCKPIEELYNAVIAYFKC